MLFTTLTNINNNLTQVINQNEAQAREIQQLRETSIVQGDCLKMLDAQIRKLMIDSQNFSAFIEANGNVENPNANLNIDVIARELQERFTRSLNFLIFNLPEEQPNNTDNDRIITVLNQIGVNTNGINIRRLGREIRDRPRAIVVTLQSRQDVILVLRNRNSFPRGSTISEDRTREQRLNFAALKQRVQQHNRTTPSDLWRIKYINGAPTIVRLSDSSPVSKNE